MDYSTRESATREPVPLGSRQALAQPVTSRAPSRLRRLSKYRNLVAGAAIMVLFVLISIFGPLVTPYGPNAISPLDRLQPPSAEHLMGTDHLGRDIFTRAIYGARYSIAIAVGAILVGGTIGWLAGVVAGYFGGKADRVVVFLVDTFLAFPMELFALVMIATLGQGLQNLVFAIALAVWPRVARVVRGEVLKVVQLEYVEAAKAIGARSNRVILKHILSNTLAPTTVALSFYVGTALLVEASLGFLGLGVPPPTPTWGRIVSDGRNYMQAAPWVITTGGLAIGLMVLGLNLFGDGLRDAVDPRTSRVTTPTERR